MIDRFWIKSWIGWPLVRAQLCSLAAAASFNSTWRAPRDGLRYGAGAYGLALTLALAALLPATLLQLAAGQLSQQDAVGMWRAVPFFKGVGYLRLLASLAGAAYTAVYLALLLTYFLYTATHSIPFPDCIELVDFGDGEVNTFNGTTCLNQTFAGPVGEAADYFTTMAVVIIVLWALFPFVLFNPIKMMKQAMYLLGPVVVVLFTIVVCCIGDVQGLQAMGADWAELAGPRLWFAAVTQAMWTTQTAGGYLVSAGDTVYASTNVLWTALTITGLSIVASWCGLAWWAAVAGGLRDSSAAAVLVVTYQLAEDLDLSPVWPLLIFAALFVSGIITMLTLLHPLYDRFRRVGGYRWRLLALGSSAVGAGAGVAALAGRLPALQLLDDTAAPVLIAVATVLEILAFVCIYGTQVLVGDIEFLINRRLRRGWVWGWFCVPAALLALLAWWATSELLRARWLEPPWSASGICAAALLAVLIFVVGATMAVLSQVQYDFCAKLKASFKPSRHWGPQDPIAHYYWVARREAAARGLAPRYRRPQLGQLSLSSNSVLDSTITKHLEVMMESKQRSNSDDWLYTVHRRRRVRGAGLGSRARSRSLDWPGAKPRASTDHLVPLDLLACFKECNNNVVGVRNFVIDNGDDSKM